MTENAEVGGPLHVVMAAENVGAAAGLAHVAQGQLEVAVGAGVVVADGVLDAAHAPDEGARTVFIHEFGGLVDQLFWYAGHPLHLLRGPVGDLLADLVHPVDALSDELLSLPIWVAVNLQVISCLPESRRTSHQATKRDQDERETTLASAPAMTSARMIGDGLEKGFVSWWLGVKKTLNIT